MAERIYSESTDRIVATEPVEVRRYATHTRINHWFTAFLIMALILSGFALFWPPLFFLTALFGGGHRCGAAGPAGAHNDNISQVERPPFYGLLAVA